MHDTGGQPGLVLRHAGFHVSWPVIVIAVAAVLLVALIAGWMISTAKGHGSRHRAEAPRPAPPARGRHQGAHAHTRRPRLWRHGSHGLPV